MRERDDAIFIEQARVAFVIYCDECGLGIMEGVELAEQLGGELEACAEDRVYADAS